MMKKIFAVAALLAFVAAPLALAHDGHSDTPDGNGGSVEPVSPNTHCWSTQNPHDYGTPGSVVYGSQSTGTGSTGVTSVSDYNLETCGVEGPGNADFDGDLEYGVGGGFFPAGLYASDPTCDYGYTPHHGATFHVHSVIPDEGAGFQAPFTVGSDPTPPTLVPSTDPEDDDGFDCVDDGSVTPDVDLDDCLESFVHAGTTTCLPGGDGGRWVWIDCEAVTEGDDISLGLTDADGDGVPDGANPTVVPPGGARAQCSVQGHIYSS